LLAAQKIEKAVKKLTAIERRIFKLLELRTFSSNIPDRVQLGQVRSRLHLNEMLFEAGESIEVEEELVAQDNIHRQSFKNIVIGPDSFSGAAEHPVQCAHFTSCRGSSTIRELQLKLMFQATIYMVTFPPGTIFRY
jgi:hypothetical protein